MLSLYLLPASTKLEVGSRLTVDGDEGHHISRVARHKVGEQIHLSDGEGVRARASIEAVGRDSVTVLIEEITVSEPAKVSLCVVQALTKSDRAHECLELLVAAGVDEIVPWQAERSIGKWDPQSSSGKWEQWIKAAVKQTRRDRVPHLRPYLRDLDRFIAGQRSDSEVILALDESATEVLDSVLFERLRDAISLASRITLIIGPEGGLSERELELLDSLQVAKVRLGTPIFRSAHAGAIALASVQASFALWR